MLTRPGRRHAVGHILYDYESLPVLIQEHPCIVWGRATGAAHIAYDGCGAWWCEQIEVSSPRHPGPLVYLAVSDPLFGEICSSLGRHRGQDIEERIADRLVHRAPDPRPTPRAALWLAAAELAGILHWNRLPRPLARLEASKDRP